MAAFADADAAVAKTTAFFATVASIYHQLTDEPQLFESTSRALSHLRPAVTLIPTSPRPLP